MRPKTRLKPIAALLLCLLPAAHAAHAQAAEQGSWYAVSNTAQSITGDIVISGQKISINFASFLTARVRELTAAEISALFDPDGGVAGTGSLYRLDIPAAKKFLHRNSLCGAEDAIWMASYASGKSLELVFFSGQKVPVFTVDALANTTDTCGRFSYTR